MFGNGKSLGESTRCKLRMGIPSDFPAHFPAHWPIASVYAGLARNKLFYGNYSLLLSLKQGSLTDRGKSSCSSGPIASWTGNGPRETATIYRLSKEWWPGNGIEPPQPFRAPHWSRAKRTEPAHNCETTLDLGDPGCCQPSFTTIFPTLPP